MSSIFARCVGLGDDSNSNRSGGVAEIGFPPTSGYDERAVHCGFANRHVQSVTSRVKSNSNHGARLHSIAPPERLHSNIPPEAAAVVVERRSTLSRVEARVVVFDYFGDKRKQLSEKLAVSPETIRTYWKRVYLKTNIRRRDEIRVWVERLLQKELRDET